MVRLQWVEDKGLIIDDPYGKFAIDKDGNYLGYAEFNSKERDNEGDQEGHGDNNFLKWDGVATTCSDRYVQLYDK